MLAHQTFPSTALHRGARVKTFHMPGRGSITLLWLLPFPGRSISKHIGRANHPIIIMNCCSVVTTRLSHESVGTSLLQILPLT